ncbi:MAG: hypothetical protein JST44_17750 [Cyanobacteria bacterium SZAS LIN-5]|nr:hypothetical protein [Cyanobacteria bacterium SZAS LIN-5]
MKRVLALSALATLSHYICASSALAQTATRQPKAPASAMSDWYGTLRQCEEQMAQGHFSQAANGYIKALKTVKSLSTPNTPKPDATESVNISCGDKRFIELMAVGDELAARGSKPMKPDSAATVAADNKLTESAMKCREETAETVCGADSGAVIAAWQGLLLHYNMVQNRTLADVYQKKLLSPTVRAKFSEVEPYRTAGSARASAWLTTELQRSRKLKQIPALSGSSSR